MRNLQYTDKSFDYGHRLRMPEEAFGLCPSVLSSITYKFRAAEDETNIYIGYDLNAPYTLRFDPGSFGNNLHDLIKYKAFPRWGNGDDKLIKAIGHSKEEVEQDITLLDPFVEIADKQMKIFLNSATVEYTLRDKQFPKLKDRKILPLVVIDTTTGNVNFCHDRYANTYRQSRSIIEIEEFKSNYVRTAVDSTSFALFVDIVVSSPPGFYATT